ncbi:MAG: hypothetical protein KIT31_34580 [Deltaproteobacteria bacterium]|nr:hypothetical protein [Deltaproteobacteria bacterium]
MTRLVVAKQHIVVVGIALCACGNGKGRPEVPTPPAGAVAPDAAPGEQPAHGGAVPTDVTPPPVVKKPPRRTKIEAPHGGAIVELAVTADGKAAVSCDELNGIRLWPALDGSLEPRAVDLPRPTSLAIGPDPKGFVIAMLDEVGGLIVQVVDRDGITLTRASLGTEPAYAAIAMSDRGLLALRADQRIVRVGAEGAIQKQLPAEPGQRILGFTVTGDRAAAVIETPGTGAGAPPPVRRARWFTAGAELAWGAWIDAGSEVSTTLAVSPSGKRVGYLLNVPAKGTTYAIVVDAAKGTVVANEPAPGIFALGLPDDDHLALGAQGGITWIDLTKLRSVVPIPPVVPPAPNGGFAPPVPPFDRGLLGIGGGRAVTATSGELVLATPTTTSFLGYELESPSVAAVAPKGRLLIGLGETFALLDGQLLGQPAPDLAVPAGSAIADLRWLAGDDWLVESSRVNDGVTSVALVDAATKRSTPVRANMSMVQTLMYEPSTRLVTLSLGESPEVLRHEVGKLRLDKVSTLPRPAGYERAELVPVAPALAGGTQLVVVHMRDRLTLRWVKDPKQLDKGPSVTIDGSLAGVDAAGRVYVWHNDAQGMLELAMFVDGKRTGTLPSEGPTAVWPDPKGTQVLQVGQRSIALVGLDGTRRWAQALQGVTEALWLEDGSIAIISAAGVARLDAATGNVLAARCGWRFGLTSKQHPVSPRFEPVCTQLR